MVQRLLQMRSGSNARDRYAPDIEQAPGKFELAAKRPSPQPRMSYKIRARSMKLWIARRTDAPAGDSVVEKDLGMPVLTIVANAHVIKYFNRHTVVGLAHCYQENIKTQNPDPNRRVAAQYWRGARAIVRSARGMGLFKPS